METETLAKEISELRIEISKLRTEIKNHFNPENSPSIADEVNKLNGLLPELIKVMKDRK